MPKSKKMSLTEARKKDDLKGFIRQHSSDCKGDLDKLDKALKRPASQKSKEAPKASSRDNRDD